MIEHVEPLVDAAIASLRAGLNDALDAINATHDDFDVQHVPEDAYRPGGLAKAPTAYPFVEVSAADSFLTLPTVGQAAYDRAETTMIVAAWCRHVDDETLYRQTMRYGQALVQVLAAYDAFGAETRVERMRTAYRRNPETQQTEQLIACVVVATQVIVDDEAP